MEGLKQLEFERWSEIQESKRLSLLREEEEERERLEREERERSEQGQSSAASNKRSFPSAMRTGKYGMSQTNKQKKNFRHTCVFIKRFCLCFFNKEEKIPSLWSPFTSICSQNNISFVSLFYPPLSSSQSFYSFFRHPKILKTAFNPAAIPEDEEYDLMMMGDEDGYYDESVMFSAPRHQTSMHGSSRRDIFLEDKLQDMTWGRRIALSLMNSRWYNPLAGQSDQEYSRRLLQQTGASSAAVTASSKDEEDRNGGRSSSVYNAARQSVSQFHPVHQKPSLARAWAYFEHISLDRYIVDEDDDDDDDDDNGNGNDEDENAVRNGQDGDYIDELRADYDRQKKNGKKKNKNSSGGIFGYCCQGERQLSRAEPGTTEHKTKLYNAINTPHSQVTCRIVPCFCLGFIVLFVCVFLGHLKKIISLTFNIFL